VSYLSRKISWIGTTMQLPVYMPNTPSRWSNSFAIGQQLLLANATEYLSSVFSCDNIPPTPSLHASVCTTSSANTITVNQQNRQAFVLITTFFTIMCNLKRQNGECRCCRLAERKDIRAVIQPASAIAIICFRDPWFTQPNPAYSPEIGRLCEHQDEGSFSGI